MDTHFNKDMKEYTRKNETQKRKNINHSRTRDGWRNMKGVRRQHKFARREREKEGLRVYNKKKERKRKREREIERGSLLCLEGTQKNGR